jgi:hypothetical protein
MNKEVPMSFYLAAVLGIKMDRMRVKSQSREAEQERLSWSKRDAEVRLMRG